MGRLTAVAEHVSAIFTIGQPMHLHKEEKELAKREKALAEKQLLVQRLGLDENVEAPTVRASAEAVNSMRAKIAEMKAKHNKFVQENGLRLELFPE
jgi:hypothetical protein